MRTLPTKALKSIISALALRLVFIQMAMADPATWTATSPMNTARSSHTSTLLPNGMVLVAGGYGGSTALSSAELFSPDAGTWTTTGTMNSSHGSLTATLLPSGKVLVVGGSAAAELYNPETGQWTATGTLKTKRFNHTATLLANGMVLVTGGYIGSGVNALSSTELYNPASGAWMYTGTMSGTRMSHTATLLPSGLVLINAGSSSIAINTNVTSSEIYDPISGSFRPTGPSGMGGESTATLVGTGKVLQIGGGKGVRSYDIVSETWGGAGVTNDIHGNHAATLLESGKLLITGGSGSGVGSSSVEFFNPALGTSTRTASLNTARYYHTATALPDGRVFICGGYTGSNDTATAELFTPASFAVILTAVNGEVAGISGSYPPNSTATLTASPHPGYIFTGWTGDAIGSANPLSVMMDSDKTITAGFAQDTNDDDEDGYTNYEEIVIHGTDPALPDTDGDGAKDSEDAFPLDIAEWFDTDGDGTGDNADLDDDGDGLSDVDEITVHHTNPKLADSDGDGLSDPDEIQVQLTNPNLADTDADGLSDGAEFFTHHTNPLIGDTDGDGFLDGYEVATGKSPLDILEHPALVAEARTAIEFIFPAAVGKTYRIEDSFDLSSWDTVESGIVGNGSQIVRFYTTRNMPKRYFRVEEDAP